MELIPEKIYDPSIPENSRIVSVSVRTASPLKKKKTKEVLISQMFTTGIPYLLMLSCVGHIEVS